MKLYKNVDICNLESIIKKGILSMDECENNNWEDGKRVDNDTSFVYLFNPISKNNTFTNYGAALLEVECDAKLNKMIDTDIHKCDYEEYIVKYVEPSKIKKVIIPSIFRNHINIPSDIKITWCDMNAKYWNCEIRGTDYATNEILEQFAKTAPLEDAQYLNFFRGLYEDGTMIDLYEIEYIF